MTVQVATTSGGKVVVDVRCIVSPAGVRRIQCAVVKTRDSTARAVENGLPGLLGLPFGGRPARWGSWRAYPNVCQHWAAY